MGFKKWLWNDNASDLLDIRGARSATDKRKSRQSQAVVHDRTLKWARGAAAFTSSLLFGTNESDGVLKTVGAATKDAGAGACEFLRSPKGQESIDSIFAPPEANLEDSRTDTINGHYYDFAGNEIED